MRWQSVATLVGIVVAIPILLSGCSRYEELDVAVDSATTNGTVTTSATLMASSAISLTSLRTFAISTTSSMMEKTITKIGASVQIKFDTDENILKSATSKQAIIEGIADAHQVGTDNSRATFLGQKRLGTFRRLPQTNVCDEDSWPDKDHGLVCGECKVLVDRFSSFYNTCDGYCQRLGRECVGAWEESGDTCTVAYAMTCDETLGSSDAICECSADAQGTTVTTTVDLTTSTRIASTVSAKTTTTTTTIEELASTTATAALVMASTTTTFTTTLTMLTSYQAATNTCDEESWPDKDHGLVCGECKVLVDRFSSFYNTCDGYCRKLGRQCVGAWEETDDTCTVAYAMTCDEALGSSDAICECSADVQGTTVTTTVDLTTSTMIASTVSAKTSTTTTIAMLTSYQAATNTCDEEFWPDKDHGLVCGECKVLVDRFSSFYNTCDGYCQKLGRQCVGAWEESGDTCTVAYAMTCDEALGSSDAICECSADAQGTIVTTTTDVATPTMISTKTTTTTTTAPTTRTTPTTLAASTTSRDVLAPCVGPTATSVCDVPLGSCAILSGEQSCPEVNVKGTLTIQSGSMLQTPKLHVHAGGTLVVGTWQSPVENVEIDLQENGELLSEGSTYIYGLPKASWALLTEECHNCITISVNMCNGWKVGDAIVLVGTGNGRNGQTQANSEYRTDERTIQSMNGCRITLNQAVGQRLRSEMYKNKVPINSEVLNMGRSIHIHGSSITTRQQYTGVMQMHHTRVSHCGKLLLGEYCLHFHHVGPCPDCSFVGNAVGWPSVNKGITVHGTSNTTVEGNIVYAHMGAYMYVEDGNEIGNLIKDNALVCPTVAGCKLKNGVDKHKSSDDLEQAGLYAVSVTNDFIGNHIAGMENAFFQDFQSGGKKWGEGVSDKRSCPTAYPFGRVSDNYFHNNAGFGFYAPHSSYPTRVKMDANGLVTDWNSCLGFDPATGADNSASYTVENHVELFHNFGAGGYDGGETSFKNSIFAFGLATNYYKTFRRGIRSGPICDGCFYTNNLFPNTPGGACMWEYKDTIFEDTSHGLHVNHHCGNDGEWTGGICASHIWFTGSSEWKFTGILAGSSEWKSKFKVKNDGFPKSKEYSDSIVHYNGYTYIGTSFSHPAFKTDGCQTGEAGGDWTACADNDIRIVRIYSADRGQLMVINNDEGYTRAVPYTPWVKSAGWRRPNVYDVATKYQNGGMGYTFLVRAGQSYTLQVADGSEPDFFTLEYSDPQMPVDSITVAVEGAALIAGNACTIQSTHGRDWITPYGPYIPASGAWWDCQKWAVTYTQAQHQVAQMQHFQSKGVQI